MQVVLHDGLTGTGCTRHLLEHLQSTLRCRKRQNVGIVCAGSGSVFLYDLQRRKKLKTIEVCDVIESSFLISTGELVATTDTRLLFINFETDAIWEVRNSAFDCIYEIYELHDGTLLLDADEHVTLYNRETDTVTLWRHVGKSAYSCAYEKLQNGDIMFIHEHIEVWDKSIKTQKKIFSKNSGEKVAYTRLLEIFTNQVLGLRIKGGVDLVNLNTGLVTIFLSKEAVGLVDLAVLLQSGNIALVLDKGGIVIVDKHGKIVREFANLDFENQTISEVGEVEPGIIVCLKKGTLYYLNEKTGAVEEGEFIDTLSIASFYKT
jgi:hypothetical protein